MLTDAEQLFLEQVNRARLDPLAEAARFGIDLNENLAAGTLDGSFSRQPLAANDTLTGAARGHSADYQTGGVVGGHTGSDGRSPADRAEDAGYGSRFVGENVGFMAATNPGGSAPAFSAAQAVTTGTGLGASQNHHEALFHSSGHRQNMLRSDYVEAGIGQDHRVQFEPGWNDGRVDGAQDWTSSVMTSKFGRETFGDRFLSGVVHTDSDADRFYSIGEGVAGATVAIGATSATSTDAGGYALKLAPALTGLTAISLSVNGLTLGAELALGDSNVKLDVVNGTRLMASSDLVLGAGATEGGLLGLGDLSLTGNGLGNILAVGRGDNSLDGRDGTDTALFTGAMADYQVTVTGDTATVTDLRGGAVDQGTNTLISIEQLQFADQLHILSAPEVTLSGQLRLPGGAALDGGQMTFVSGTGDPVTAQVAADGRFTLMLDIGLSGRLEATRAHDPAEDPAITAGDALEVLRLSMGITPSFGPAAGAHFVAADIDRDGAVTAADALDVLRAALELDSPHAPGWVFVDGARDLDQMGLNANNATVPTGIELGPLAADMADLSMTAILLGNLDSLA